MQVLVGCEFSGVVRDAFRRRGHTAYSCDILDTETNPQYHYKTKIQTLMDIHWDLVILFPPCTYLSSSGARWWAKKQKEQAAAIRFVKLLFNWRVNKLCIENPVGIISSVIRKPDQIVHPWQFGHNESKSTCLWLKNLPLLKPTKIVHCENYRIASAYDTQANRRWKQRSRTYTGIAEAMAEQWGNL